MEYLEFQCSECRCGLRIRADHREKMIRCPNCHALQRYNSELPNPLPNPTTDFGAQAPSVGVSASLEQGTWALKLPDGLVLANLSRQAFEAEIRARNLGPGTWFQGGDYPAWTPLERLFQSQVPGKGGGSWTPYVAPSTTPIPLAAPHVGSSRSNQPSPGQVPYGGPQSSHVTASHIPASHVPGNTSYYGASPLEQQLPAPRSGLVLAMGILGLCLPCSFIFSLIGLAYGIGDVIRVGNGNLSKEGGTTLTVGLILCVLGLFLGGCCTFSIMLG